MSDFVYFSEIINPNGTRTLDRVQVVNGSWLFLWAVVCCVSWSLLDLFLSSKSEFASPTYHLNHSLLVCLRSPRTNSEAHYDYVRTTVLIIAVNIKAVVLANPMPNVAGVIQQVNVLEDLLLAQRSYPPAFHQASPCLDLLTPHVHPSIIINVVLRVLSTPSKLQSLCAEGRSTSGFGIGEQGVRHFFFVNG